MRRRGRPGELYAALTPARRGRTAVRARGLCTWFITIRLRAILTFTFFDVPDGFNPGESFSFSMDPDIPGNPGFGVRVADLIGTTVAFTFRDSSTFLGIFVDDPEEGEGLVLEPYTPGEPVPEPTTLLLLGSGLAGLAARSRRRAGRR